VSRSELLLTSIVDSWDGKRASSIYFGMSELWVLGLDTISCLGLSASRGVVARGRQGFRACLYLWPHVSHAASVFAPHLQGFFP
jgi:hypothetical protein